MVGTVIIVETVILGNALETVENQRRMGIFHALIVPALPITNLLGKEKVPPGDRLGIWAAFSVLEAMAVYNMARPSFGELGELEVISTNIVLPHCALAALYFFMEERTENKKISFSLVPDDGGLASTMVFRF